MSKATKSARPSHPKPTPDYPLTPHPSGRWCKKRKGKLHYFGPLDKPAEALARYEREWPYILEGRTPPPPDAGDAFTVGALANRFLVSKERKVRAGELSPRMLAEHHKICALLVAAFPRRRVDDLRPEDFAALREQLAERLGPVALKTELQRIRAVFRYAFENRYIDRPVPFGDEFSPPPKVALLKARQDRGEHMFEAAELRTILDAADPVWRALLLLSLNCGFGNADLATLTRPVLESACESGWLSHTRSKTGIGRRAKLWPETVAAVRLALPLRPDPDRKEHADRAFLSAWGRPLVGVTLRQDGRGATNKDNLGDPWRRLLARLGIPQRGWYALRHTFATVGSRARDPDALRIVMGHKDESMLGHYVERIDDDRLSRVTEAVRTWLFAAPQEGGAA